jgi:hypothetical protein
MPRPSTAAAKSIFSLQPLKRVRSGAITITLLPFLMFPHQFVIVNTLPKAAIRGGSPSIWAHRESRYFGGTSCGIRLLKGVPAKRGNAGR